MSEIRELQNLRVLIVDDVDAIHQDFVEMLRDPGRSMASDGLAPSFASPPGKLVLPTFELLHARSGQEACDTVEETRRSGRPVAVAYIDLRMPPGIDGIETLRRIRHIDSDVEVVIMTAFEDWPLSEIVAVTERLDKLLYIRKPFTPAEVKQMTLALVAKWNIAQELAASRRQLTASHGRLRAVLDATGDAIAMYDRAARLVFANRSYEQLFDVPPPELRGLSRTAAMTHFDDVVPGVPPSGDAHASVSGKDGSLVQPAGGSAGSADSRPARVFHKSWRPVRAGDGDVIGDLVVLRDASQGIETERMKLEVERLHAQMEDAWSLDGIVGSSAGIRHVCALIRQVAHSDLGVLVHGESGTGKEMVARALHSSSRRRKGPFVAINLAAVPETLLESDLFGHEQGAFTGAASRRPGCFEQAHGGTLLLDEIGDMPAALQPKLLRVLQEGRIRRLGGTADVRVDVRVVAATNRDLKAAVRDGAFREDLYYRIAVFPIEVPPLRTRPEDVLLLAAHFLKKHAGRIGRRVGGVSAAAALLLTRYRWPGNVRELENVICRAMVLETTDVLQAGNIPQELSLRGAAPAAAPVGTLAETERQAIARALDASDHNLTRAARLLGIDRTTLHRKLKKYGRRPRG